MVAIYRLRVALLLFLWFFFFLPTIATASSSTPSSDSNAAVSAAILKCRTKLAEDPTFPPAQHMLGLLLLGEEDDESLTLLLEAGLNDERPLATGKRIDCLTRAANGYERNDIIKARTAYVKTLTIVEDQGTCDQILQQATALLLQDTSSILELSPLSQQLTDRFPESPTVHQFQGAIARLLGGYEQAYMCYHTATTLYDDKETGEEFVKSLLLAASAARQAGEDLATQLEYLETAKHAAQHQPVPSTVQANVWNNIGIAYKKSNQKENAIRCFREALNLHPSDGHTLAHLASLNVDMGDVSSLDADYVSGLFDGYAARFDDELVNKLDYVGHEWVANEVLTRIPNQKNATIVDVGCGTGLVGAKLSKNNNNYHLFGVDLSQRMVEQAWRRHIYEQVIQGDAAVFLLTLSQIDAIVAADVFIYMGDLIGIFQASHSALKEGGLVICTVELADGGMKLLPSGRFGHSQQYIKQVAQGFDLVEWKEGVLRTQHGKPVRGAVVVLRKKGV